MGLLGNLMVKLGINTSQFTSGLNAAAGAANSFSQKLANNFKSTTAGANGASKAFNVFAKNGSNGFKDVGRIAQGIIISQTFYAITSSIKGSARALVEFSSDVEQARTSFALMLKDGQKASRFTEFLQDLAAQTPLTFQQSVDSARKLLAYGFNPDNMKPLMSTLSDAASAAGDPEVFNRVAKAIGQIHTKGKLATQEILQLTEAGIPAFEILRDKLKLTNDQLANIGKQKIPADIAINAILKGMQERYGGAGRAMSNTMKGMWSNIADDLKIIGSTAFEPMYYGAKKVVTKIRDTLDNLREVVRNEGMAGLLKSIFPAEMFPKIQIFAANIKMFMQNLVLLWQAFAPLRAAFTEFALNVLNLVLPVLNAFVRVIAVIIEWINSCSGFVRGLVGAFGGLLIAAWAAQLLMNFGAALRGLFIVKAIGQLIIWLAQAIRVLAVAMVSNPWIALLTVAGGALLYFGMTSKKVSGWINNLGAGITKTFGVDPSKQFAPKMKKNNQISDEFNKNLSVSKDRLDKMGDSAEKAGKKAKDGLQAFDEVFNLKDPYDENMGNPDIGEISDIGIPSIPPVEIPEPEFPEVDTPIQDWVNNFKDNLLSKLKNTLAGAGIGALIGALIGGVLGGPGGAVMGAKIGALAGGIAGYFWDQMSDQMHNSFYGAGIGAGIGAVIGGILGGPGGAVIGAAIGAVAGAIVGWFWEDIKKFFMSSTGTGAGVGAGIGGVVGFAFGGPFGAAIGAALGGTIGGIVGHFWDDMVKWFTSDTGKGTIAGTAIGASVGMMIGGPVGSIVGSIVGGIIGNHWKEITAWWNDTKQKLGTWWSDTKTGFDTWWGDTETGFTNWYNNTTSGMATWWNDTKVGLGTWWADTKTGFSSWWSDNTSGFNTWWSDTKSGFGSWWNDTTSGLQTWWNDTTTKFGDWHNWTWKDLSQWWGDTKKGFGDWFSNTFQGLSTWYNDTTGKLGSWWGTTKSGFSSWWSDTKGSINNWAGDTWGSISNWYSNTYGKLSSWWGNTKSNFSSWWSDSKQGFSDWASSIYYNVTSWFGQLGDKLHNFFEDLKFWKSEADKDYRDTSQSYEVRGRGGSRSMAGHARGGVFNKEHIARFAEGNRAEAIIPLENAGAMQPFVDAVAGGVSASMGSIVAQMGNAFASPTGTPTMDDRPILYVGTLIADDKGLRELERKMQVIRTGEQRRRG